MRLEQLRSFMAMLDIDFASLEEAYIATLLNGDALGVRFIGGKVEFEVIKHEMIYGNAPDMMIIDDIVDHKTYPMEFGQIEGFRFIESPVLTQSAEAEKQAKAREQANRRTKEAKKPLPYYHGHKRRF